MAKRVVDDAALTAVADAIRAKTGKTDGLTFPADFEISVEDVFVAGEKSAYDRFWDAYQQNGERANYDRAFGGTGWTAETFKPKYLIRPTRGEMYMAFSCSDVGKIDESILDTSQMSKLTMTFYNDIGMGIQGLYHVEIDCSSLTEMSSTFNYNTRLETIVLKNVPETCNFTAGFYNCIKLTNFTVTGTIGGTTIDLHWSTKLSKASIESVINALSSTTTGLAVTLSLAAVNAAFETSEGVADGSTSAEWTELANTKSNWTINLS